MDIEKVKDIIRKFMGDHFVDAIYQGTTQDTLTVHFENALCQIAAVCEANKGITPHAAGKILVRYNPDGEYYVRGFHGMLGIADPVE